MNEFQKRFKNFDNRKLLKIIEEAENYQRIAVQAAKEELSKREVTDEEIQFVKDEFGSKQNKIDKRKKQIKDVKNKAKGIGNELYETVKPVQKEPQTADRKINLIVILFGLLAGCQIFKDFGLLTLLLTDDLSSWDFSTVEFLFPILILPIAVFLFWRRFKIGWILMSVFFVYHIVGGIVMFFKVRKRNNERITNEFFDIESFNSLFPQVNPIVYLLSAVIFATSLWFINNEDVRNKFVVSQITSIITIGISVIIFSTIFSLI